MITGVREAAGRWGEGGEADGFNLSQASQVFLSSSLTLSAWPLSDGGLFGGVHRALGKGGGGGRGMGLIFVKNPLHLTLQYTSPYKILRES